jgi:hypothetical protein
MKIGKLTITWGAPTATKPLWTGPIPPTPPPYPTPAPEPEIDPWDEGGGPAFPASCADGSYPGISRRYWTAVQILAGQMDGGWRPDNRKETIAFCFAAADAMIGADESDATSEPPTPENPL